MKAYKLIEEKKIVLDDINTWVNPIKKSSKIGTHDMLKCIIAKCESLIESDF